MIENTPKSTYIHIPFCLSKCNYCAFISFTNKNIYFEEYVNALITEISETLSRVKTPELSTIYIGGGTPSLITPELYELLFNKIRQLCKITDTAEITIEINPATVNFKYLQKLRKIGINRLSIGAQTFDNRILALLNRKHNACDILDTVKTAKLAGFENISIDLIYGLPAQTMESWENTLQEAIDLNVNHISAYGLKIEEGTVFAENPPSNLPDDDLCADFYLKTIDFLTKNKYKHYEISNFTKKGFESKHNTTYWKNNEYFGFGLAAHGYVNGIRYSNSIELDKYLKNPTQRAFENVVSAQEKIEEALFLGLRMSEGLNITKFKTKYNIDILKKYEHILEKYTKIGLLTCENSQMKLTTTGMMLSNTVLAEFLE